MKHKLQLSSSLKKVFYGAFSVLFVSGSSWLFLKYVVQMDAGTMSVWLMKVHGGAAMIALVIFGWLIPSHIQPGLSQRRNVVPGTTMIVVVVFLGATGYGLYYFGDEIVRNVTSIIHSVIGCAFPLILGWHIKTGRRKSKK